MSHKTTKTSHTFLFVIQVATICTLAYFGSWYGVGCSILALILHSADMVFAKLNDAPVKIQKEKCKTAGLALIIPAIALCGLSAYQLISCCEKNSSFREIIVVCAMIAVQVLLLLYFLIQKSKSRNVVSAVMRHIEITMLLVLLSLLVSQFLWLGDETQWKQMVCLTGCVLGGVVFLLGCNMLICSFCGYRTIKQSIKFLAEQYRKRKRYFHYASLGKDGFMVLAKVILSIWSQSFFMFANALFSCCIGLARYTALKMNQQESSIQLKLFRRVSWILSGAGLCYAGYSVRLFFGGKPGDYNMVMALAIALYTFVEFGIQIYDLHKIQKQKDIEAEALRLIGIASILISFVLTQTAIMSISEVGEHTFSDGLSGVVFGGLVVLVGIAAQFRCFYYRKNLH